MLILCHGRLSRNPTFCWGDVRSRSTEELPSPSVEVPRLELGGLEPSHTYTLLLGYYGQEMLSVFFPYSMQLR